MNNERPRSVVDNSKITPELENQILDRFQEFGITSNEEYFIFKTSDGKKHFIHKWNEVPLRKPNGETERMRIQDYIQYFVNNYYENR